MSFDVKKELALQQFNNEVGIKFQLYNSLFSALPFHRIDKTGVLLALLQSYCEESLEKGLSPQEILDTFFKNNIPNADDSSKLDLLFRFVQYAERQVVLFDALEDSAFRKLRSMDGPGTLTALEQDVRTPEQSEVLKEKFKDFAVRLVLTAHPTQFYPGEVLAIIHDLCDAIADADTTLVNQLLMQLGKTPFFKESKPTPFDEAVSLVWYLEHVFYPAAGRIINKIKTQFPEEAPDHLQILRMGFWPGGDRDGNPFVKVDTTLKVAETLRAGILRCYYNDVKELRRRLTFKGITQILADLEKKLYDSVFIPGQCTLLTQSEIIGILNKVAVLINKDHRGLFVEKVEDLKNKVELFGLFFASLDIRQESTVHGNILNNVAALSDILPGNYAELTDEEKAELIVKIDKGFDYHLLTNEVEADTLKVAAAIKQIQQENGAEGCHRFIISQTNSFLNVLEVYALFLLNNIKPQDIDVDIVPLFETIDDLKNAKGIMQKLYSNEIYFNHLKKRGYQQTIMLGFSDGTKDGGYLMANWSIYKAKEELTAISRQYDIEVVFFDGRGGPPARGGGKTHKFYAAMGQNIANNEIQLTVQGQTISSNFGIIDSAQYNIEQMIHAGISNTLSSSRLSTLDKSEEKLITQLAEDSLAAYLSLRNHSSFFDYLSHVSPLRFYAATNIGSRPAKRGGSSKLSLKDLRAIPYVGSWSQLKQNVTGYYGVGKALKKLDDDGRLNEVKELYNNSTFFKTLMDNCEMALLKSYFPLTHYLQNHPLYGDIWNNIHDEYQLTRRYILKISGHQNLMDDYPVDQQSIQIREKIVLPVLAIQQYAIAKVRHMEEQVMDSPLKSKFEKLVMRCSFGIINAGRNSA